MGTRGPGLWKVLGGKRAEEGVLSGDPQVVRGRMGIIFSAGSGYSHHAGDEGQLQPVATSL